MQDNAIPLFNTPIPTTASVDGQGMCPHRCTPLRIPSGDGAASLGGSEGRVPPGDVSPQAPR